MKLLRAVLGRLDPWAALLLGVLLALGVIILLATPGSWHKVVGPAPPGQLAPPAPTDVAAFALGGASGTCTAVVWLHVDRAPAALTAVVLAPETQGFVPGAGFTPLRRIVDEVGPGAAAVAMGQALDVPLAAWITLDKQALRLALAPHSSAGEARAPLLQYKRARAAWAGRGEAHRVWTTQYQALGFTLARLPFQRINVVSFSNYVLGWGHVQSNLNLQGAASLATTFEELMPAGVDVRGAAAIVETCRRGEAWRVDRSAIEQLRRSLAFGLTPPAAGTSVQQRPRPARVLVVLPGPGYRSDAYVDEVRRRLRRSAGVPVAVQAVRAPRWDGLVARTVAATESWRPLAVLVAPPTDLGSVERAQKAAVALRRLGETLRTAGQPAVLSAPLPVEMTVTAASTTDTSATAALAVDALNRDALAAAVRASGQPVSPLAGLGGAPAGAQPIVQSLDARLTAAARANVATLVRACWPGALAPRLASTRLGFSFAARRRTTVAVWASPNSATDAVASAPAMAMLRTWGYQAANAPATDWTPGRSGRGVYYRAGMRRAALALAGDLGLRAAAVVADEGAPAALTLSLGS
ncbi:MAG: hypothetical protein NTX16_09235 [Actinobacteria bacterium]|nr:hypothetical protein [Actinomycetota bacterium]